MRWRWRVLIVTFLCPLLAPSSAYFQLIFPVFFHHVLIRLPFFFCKTPQLCLWEWGNNSSTTAIIRFSKSFQFQLWLAIWLVFLHSKLRTWKLAHSPSPPPPSFFTWPPPLWVRAVDRIPSISRGSENIKMQLYYSDAIIITIWQFKRPVWYVYHSEKVTIPKLYS